MATNHHPLACLLIRLPDARLLISLLESLPTSLLTGTYLTGSCVADLTLVPPPVALTSPTSQLLHDIRQKSEASTQESLKALQKEKDALMQVPACCIELFSCCLRSLSSGTGQESEQLRKIWNDVSNS